MEALQNKCSAARGRARCLSAAFALLVCTWPALAQRPTDWQEQIRTRVAAKQLADALALADRRLAAAPADPEARGWRARLLAWSGRLPEAEAEYRRGLELAPQDTDILVGLADVLALQQRFAEALTLLSQAQELAPSRPDTLTHRGRVLRSLNRMGEAQVAFRAALALDSQNDEAKVGLASLQPEPRHEFRIGTDTDFFNYTDHALAQSVSLRSQWSPRWATSFAGNFYQRLGQDAGKFTASGTYRLSPSDALTVGGAAGHDQGIIPKGEAFFEYGHGFRVGTRHFLRGVETTYRQQWLWYTGPRILTLTGGGLFYLPRGWTWSLAVTAARSRFPSGGAEWRPSCLTRLGIPIHRRVTANLFYGVGTENFAQVDQIGRFSARTFGGGARYQFTPRQDLTGYVLRQYRTQDRTQTSFGVSYGLRF